MIYEVMNMDGEVLGVFDTEEDAHQYADAYGDKTGRFAYVEQVQA